MPPGPLPDRTAPPASGSPGTRAVAGARGAPPAPPPLVARLRADALELAHLILDALPGAVVATDAYVRLRRSLSRTPDRYRDEDEAALPFTDERWRDRKLATARTDLCVEGFPGSGNSYLSNCIRAAISHPVRVESHFHHTAQLRRAMRFGVPALVVVREPRPACAAARAKQPALAELLVVTRWILYHRFVACHLDRLDVVLFEEVVADVDVARRRSRAVAALVDGPVVAVEAFRRTGDGQLPPRDPGPWAQTLYRRADRIHARIAGRVRRLAGAAAAGHRAG